MLAGAKTHIKMMLRASKSMARRHSKGRNAAGPTGKSLGIERLEMSCRFSPKWRTAGRLQAAPNALSCAPCPYLGTWRTTTGRRTSHETCLRAPVWRKDIKEIRIAPRRSFPGKHLVISVHVLPEFPEYGIQYLHIAHSMASVTGPEGFDDRVAFKRAVSVDYISVY